MSKVDLNKMSGLLAVKGQPVAPAQDAAQRVAEKASRQLREDASKDEKTIESSDEIVNLSFKVPLEFRKRFKLAAINADITQNELVQQALVVWEKQAR